MAFWSENFGQAGTALKDPKRKFRFKVTFTGIDNSGNGGIMWYAKTVSKPSFTIESTEHTYLNHKFYYPGAVTWQDVTMTLVDPVDPDMTATLSAIIQGGGYQPPLNADSATSMGTMSKATATQALGGITIDQIDAAGETLETWTLHNPFITEVKYGDLAYGDDELVEVSITLKYDWAKVETTNASAAAIGTGNSFFATNDGAGAA
jgi:hypothetical protein